MTPTPTDPEPFTLDGTLPPLGQWRNPCAGPCAGCDDANRGEHRHPDDSHPSIVAPRMLCDRCAERLGMAPCVTCGTWSPDDVGATDLQGRTYCEPCAERMTECDRCHDVAMPNGTRSDDLPSGWHNVDGSPWCYECTGEHATYCDGCNEWTDSESSTYCDRCEITTCESCGRDHDHAGSLDECEPVHYTPTNPARVPDVPTYPDGSPLTVGVEIECTLPAYPFDWEAKEDGSLKGEGDFETVSPILEGRDGLARLHGAVVAMRADGCEPCSGGGVHVHVGARDHYTVGDIFRILESWETWGEHVAAGLVPGYRVDGSGYQSPVASSVRSGRSAWSTLVRDSSRAHNVNPDESARVVGWNAPSRNVTLNVQAMARHGTLEYRLFPSSVTADDVTTWAGFVAGFTASAARLEPARVRALCDRFGTFRTGLRIVARANPALRDGMVKLYGRRVARGDMSREHESHPSRKPWGRRGGDGFARAMATAERTTARTAPAVTVAS